MNTAELRPARRPSKERLLHLLAEAAELEHNLLCSYLFAQFGLKEGAADGLTVEQAAAVSDWSQKLLGVCIEEMTHFAQIANLTVAIGGRVHINRPNIPVSAGYHPAAVVVEFSKLDVETLQHFTFLERPNGLPIDDGPSFRESEPYVRRAHHGDLMPNSPNYETIGEFYEVLKAELQSYSDVFGEATLFSGPTGSQLTATELHTEGLRVVTDLGSAFAAIDDIIEEGEGSSAASNTSHFAMFTLMREQYDDLLRSHPDFEASRDVGRNPVMHAPMSDDRTCVTSPDASRVLDAGNAAYGFMLRCLGRCFETSRGNKRVRALLLSGCVTGMKVTALLGRALTTMSASDKDSSKAGLSFAMTRSVQGWQRDEDFIAGMLERAHEIAETVGSLNIDAEKAIRARTALELWIKETNGTTR